MTAPIPTFIPTPEPAPPKKRRGLKITGGIVGGILLFTIGHASAGTPTTQAAATARTVTVTAPPPAPVTITVPASQVPPSTVTVSAQPSTVTIIAAAAAPATADGFGPGTYVVGKDIKPGTYKTAGPADSLCYWARNKDTTGDAGSIIANGVPQGPATVTIKSTDGAFETSGCKNWVPAK